MSLIINMLKDLEKRENNNHIQPYTGHAHAHQHDRFKWVNKKSATLLLGVIFLVLMTLNILKKPHKFTTNLLPMMVERIPTTNINPLLDTPWVKPVSITGITLQVKDNITEMTFLLDHAALYRLVSDGMRNQMEIYIDRATLQSELPAINSINTAILNIHREVIHDDTKFILTLAPNAFIKYVNLNESKQSAELVIAIESTGNSLEEQAKASPQIVKTTAMQSLLAQQYKRALEEIQNSNYQSAITDLSALLKVDPSFQDARVSLAALLLDQGSDEKARAMISEGLQLNPNYSPFIELKARMLTSAGKLKLALALLQNSPPAMNENPDYHAFIAALYQKTNQNLLAASLYKQLLALNPHKGNWWFGLGVALDKSGYDKEAADAYTKAIAEGHLNADSIAYLQNRLHDLEGDDHGTG